MRLALPADPGVAALQVAGGEAEQQAAELAPVSVEQEVAQMRADGLAVALGMVEVATVSWTLRCAVGAAALERAAP